MTATLRIYLPEDCGAYVWFRYDGVAGAGLDSRGNTRTDGGWTTFILSGQTVVFEWPEGWPLGGYIGHFEAEIWRWEWRGEVNDIQMGSDIYPEEPAHSYEPGCRDQGGTLFLKDHIYYCRVGSPPVIVHTTLVTTARTANKSIDYGIGDGYYEWDLRDLAAPAPPVGEPIGKYQCPYCSEMFDTGEKLNEHIGRVHPEVAAVGTYAEITEIVAPSSASAGETVPVTIKIRNNGTFSYAIATNGLLETREWLKRFMGWQEDICEAGKIRSFSGSFIMPDLDVIIHAYSYYATETGWVFDVEKTQGVSLVIPYEGTLSKKELEYDSVKGSIPVY